MLVSDLRKRTPRSLDEAIADGFVASKITPDDEKISYMRLHIQDYMGQKFTSAMLGLVDISELYRAIFPRKEDK